MARGMTSTNGRDQSEAKRCRSGIVGQSTDVRSIKYRAMGVVRRSINKRRTRIQKIAWQSVICFRSRKMVVRGCRPAQEMYSDDEIGVNLTVEGQFGVLSIRERCKFDNSRGSIDRIREHVCRRPKSIRAV